MADFMSRTDNPLPAASKTQKRTGPNISSSWVIMVLSALVAMVAFLVLTAKPNAKIVVAVAADNITTGAQITDASFQPSEVSLSGPEAGRFVLWSEKDRYVGFTTAGPINKGDLVLKSQVRQAATANGLNAMSIPVAPTHAVGGELAIGDRVDVYDEEAEKYAARDIEVIAVREGVTKGALSTGESFHIIVAVTADQAANVGIALKHQKIDVIRATGGLAPARNPSSASAFTNEPATQSGSKNTTTTESP